MPDSKKKSPLKIIIESIGPKETPSIGGKKSPSEGLAKCKKKKKGPMAVIIS